MTLKSSQNCSSLPLPGSLSERGVSPSHFHDRDFCLRGVIRFFSL